MFCETEGKMMQNICASDRPYLARVSDLADELERVGDHIEAFIARCRGGALAEQARPNMPRATGHLAEIDRAVENLARADKLARELQTIG